MAITDNTYNPVEQMRDAWVQALDELVNSSDDQHVIFKRVLDLVSELRNSEQLTQLQSTRMINMMWDSVRESDLAMYNAVMSMAMVFALEIDNLPKAIEHFVACMVPYRTDSKIVDKQTLQRTPAIKELTEVFHANVWLFMLFFGATQFRATNRFMLGAGLIAKTGKTK